VAANETLTSLTVKAESALDSGTSGTAAVTLTGGEAHPVSLADLASHIAGLSENSAVRPHTVKLAPVNISENGVMGAINTAAAGGRYIILDLSDCSAAGNTISGSWDTPSSNDMNVIKDNRHIVGITLPDSLTSIGNAAFNGCGSLASVTIPSSVTSIGEGAFAGCGSLTSVTIPASVISIGSYAFYGCTSLASVTFAERSDISAENFAVGGTFIPTFPGDLRAKYFAGNGGARTYMRTVPDTDPGKTGTWTKQQ
jgi:hypothetical protein